MDRFSTFALCVGLDVVEVGVVRVAGDEVDLLLLVCFFFFQTLLLSTCLAVMGGALVEVLSSATKAAIV